MALVEVKNLKKYFYGPKGAVHAVDDVTMNIDAGETMGVVGESGCGKSTLGRTIIHLQKSTGGSVHFNGKDITNPTPQELKKLRSDVQIIFQDPYSSLNPRMTVEDTIKEPLLISGKCDKQNVDAETERLMDMVGIARRIKMSYPHELDGGRRQRVGIARALALDPKFIVCDEPVSALDVSIQAQILNLLMDLQEEHGLAYIVCGAASPVYKSSFVRNSDNRYSASKGKNRIKGRDHITDRSAAGLPVCRSLRLCDRKLQKATET